MFLYYLTQFLNLNYKKWTKKCVFLKTWKKLRKPGKNFEKVSSNPDKKYIILIIFLLKNTFKVTKQYIFNHLISFSELLLKP